MNILLIGDIHGDIDSLGYAKELMHEYACEAVVQLGDFGLYWNGYSDEFTHQAYAMFSGTERLYILPGNHENYGVLAEKGWLDRRSKVMLPRRAGYYLPTGCRFKLGDTWCLAYGGAYSVDKDQRIEGRSWWADEVSNPRQHAHAMHWNGKVDVVFSHDAPSWADIPMRGYTFGPGATGGKNVYPETTVNRAKLQEVFDKYEPHSWYHGHWHVSYTDALWSVQPDGTTQHRCTGLAHNMHPGFWKVVEV